MSGLSGEDRARLEVLGQYVDCEVALRALALIDQQAKALEAADELAWKVEHGYSAVDQARAYRSARAVSGLRDEP